MNAFVLHPAIAACTHFIMDWPLCRVVLMEDARYPWVILVPRRAGLTEIADLAPDGRVLLIEETVRAGQAIRALPGVVKLNVGTLGNITPQLHLHVIGRAPGDPAWPGPVWGHSPAVPYTADRRGARIAHFRAAT